MIWMLFPMWGFWWILLTMGFFGWMVLCEENDRPVEVFGILLFYVVLVSFLGDFGTILTWVATKGWLYAVLGVPLYLSIGFVWGIFRYWWEQSLRLTKYLENKLEFFQANGYTNLTIEDEIPEQLLDKWMDCVGMDGHYYSKRFRFFFQEQKKRVINWMAWWWISIPSFLLKDVVVRFYAILLSKTRKVFESIDKRVWGQTSTEFDRMEVRLKERKKKTELDR